jgi:hypothetical protein
MIKIETDSMKDMVSLVDAANSEIDNVVELMGRVTTHDDWGCPERTEINEAISSAKNLVKVLQESNHGFLYAVQQALNEFLNKESGISKLFEGVEEFLKKALGIPVPSIVTGGISGAVGGAVSDLLKNIPNGIIDIVNGGSVDGGVTFPPIDIKDIVKQIPGVISPTVDWRTIPQIESIDIKDILNDNGIVSTVIKDGGVIVDHDPQIGIFGNVAADVIKNFTADPPHIMEGFLDPTTICGFRNLLI